MSNQHIINWLLEGDVSIQYQVYRDLLNENKPKLQQRIATEGWGKAFLDKQNPEGHWGREFYFPKWISTHYTLLDLLHLRISPDIPVIKKSIEQVLDTKKSGDGGIQLGPSTAEHSDICVNAMLLNYASYFGIAENKLSSVVDSILGEIMPDGGFNCITQKSGARKSSLHTTISCLEGFNEFLKNGYSYRENDIRKAMRSATEFILSHRLFIANHNGEVINPAFLKMPWPSRWKYDILRAMDYFQYAGQDWDERMRPALDHILSKQNKLGTWNMNSGYAGQSHFTMEAAGKPSRINTLRVLRVLKKYPIDN